MAQMIALGQVMMLLVSFRRRLAAIGLSASRAKALAADKELFQILRTILQILLENLLLLFNLKVLLLGSFLNYVLFVYADFNQRRGFLKVLVRGHAPNDLTAVREVFLAVGPDQLPVLADGRSAVLAFLAFPTILPLG